MDETLRLVFVLLPKRIFLQVASCPVWSKHESKHKRRINYNDKSAFKYLGSPSEQGKRLKVESGNKRRKTMATQYDDHCPNCGCKEFLAQQACRGTTTVVVTLHTGNASFSRNDTPDGELDINDLDFDDPEGPFICKKCKHTLLFDHTGKVTGSEPPKT
jgi:hypothetical protein